MIRYDLLKKNIFPLLLLLLHNRRQPIGQLIHKGRNQVIDFGTLRKGYHRIFGALTTVPDMGKCAEHSVTIFLRQKVVAANTPFPFL